MATSDLFASPAVTVLCNLERDGFNVAIAEGRLRVWPAGRLTPEHIGLIRQHKNDLLMLVGSWDDGVRDRREAFLQQLQSVKGAALPDFIFRRDVPYRRSVCFSCGETLETTRYGRCWRCSVAWRLACGVSQPADVALVYDSAKVVA